jgi:hypothetical protein
MAASVKALLLSTQILRSRTGLSLVLILLVVVVRVAVVPAASG